MLQLQHYKRAYCLYELLQEKYGADKVELGLELLAQWLSISDKPALQLVDQELLKEILLLPRANISPALLTDTLAEELRKFFGLLTIDQLYNKDAL